MESFPITVVHIHCVRIFIVHSISLLTLFFGVGNWRVQALDGIIWKLDKHQHGVNTSPNEGYKLEHQGQDLLMKSL